MSSTPVPVSTIVQFDHLNREEIMSSSPIRLGLGGRARLARLARNHDVPMSGRIIWVPRARSSVRL